MSEDVETVRYHLVKETPDAETELAAYAALDRIESQLASLTEENERYKNGNDTLRAELMLAYDRTAEREQARREAEQRAARYEEALGRIAMMEANEPFSAHDALEALSPIDTPLAQEADA
jgi:regulator of replication initiation timing